MKKVIASFKYKVNCGASGNIIPGRIYNIVEPPGDMKYVTMPAGGVWVMGAYAIEYLFAGEWEEFKQ